MNGKHRKSECPTCGAKLEAYDTVERGKRTQPGPGDTTICIRCGSVLLFTKNMTLIEPSRRRLEALMRDPTVQRALAARAQVMNRKTSLPNLDRLDIWRGPAVAPPLPETAPSPRSVLEVTKPLAKRGALDRLLASALTRPLLPK